MEEDLNLGEGARYSVILMLFLPSYIFTDVPSNYILTLLTVSEVHDFRLAVQTLFSLNLAC
jgi:hypothetical protein